MGDRTDAQSGGVLADLGQAYRATWRAGSPTANALFVGLLACTLAVNLTDPLLARMAFARWEPRVANGFVSGVRSIYVALFSLALFVWVLPRSRRYVVLFVGVVAAALVLRAAGIWVRWFGGS